MHPGQRVLFGCFSSMCSYLWPVGKAVMSVHSGTRANSRKLPSAPSAAALAHGLWPVPVACLGLKDSPSTSDIRAPWESHESGSCAHRIAIMLGFIVSLTQTPKCPAALGKIIRQNDEDKTTVKTRIKGQHWFTTGKAVVGWTLLCDRSFCRRGRWHKSYPTSGWCQDRNTVSGRMNCFWTVSPGYGAQRRAFLFTPSFSCCWHMSFSPALSQVFFLRLCFPSLRNIVT